MRQVSWKTAILIVAAMAVPMSAHRAGAEPIYHLNQNQTGFSLPGVSLPHGQDEIRAADGTTCRSAVSGSGAYVDAGVIQGNSGTNEFATYGRVVVPIGRKPQRVDCTRLYELEIERLRMELDLLKMGLGQGPTAAGGSDAGWANEGWSRAGKQ